ncbi:MAG: GGDEF domain-containing protein, partial [Mariprofundaceae bacterium]|nr:GGDEF domain-containing protein [Mariprofundaceae bacterium]
QVVQQCVREQDVMIRMGEHAFTVFLQGCAVEKGEEIANKMVKACAAIDAYDERIGISVGLSFSPADKDKVVKVLVSEADQAMYVAKALGGSRVEIAAADD